MSLTGTLLPRLTNCPKSSLQIERPVTILQRAAHGLTLAALCVAAALPVHAQNYNFTTFVGIPGVAGTSNGSGTVVGKPYFNSPGGVVVDSAKNLFVTDTVNGTIRKITPAGVVTTFAGTAGVTGTADGTGLSAQFKLPEGAAIDSAGNIFLADYANHTIRKITPAGVVTTLAGTPGTAGALDGTGTAARFSHPSSVAVDGAGNVYVADTDNNVIRKVTSAGVVTIFAGTVTFGATDGTGTAARFHYPRGIAIDGTGNLYVADAQNNTIRMITSVGVVTTIAGNPNAAGFVDGPGSAGARFNFPNSLAVGPSGNIYVADEANHAIRKLTKVTSGSTVTWNVTTLAGAGTSGYSDDAGSLAKFNLPNGITVDSDENVYVTDSTNHLIRKITASGAVTSVAGVAGGAGSLDGTGFATTAPALFFGPSSTATFGTDLYVADTNNHVIRKIEASGATTVYAGSTLTPGSTNGTGTAARFSNPSGLAIAGDGTIYVADTNTHTIRRITTGGVVTTLAGSAGNAGNTDGAGTAAKFNLPSAVAVDAADTTVYVADYSNHTIRRIDRVSGVVTTIAGTGSIGSNNAPGLLASFNHPKGLALSGATLYVADTGNQVIRRINLATSPVDVTLYAGTAGSAGSADGIAAAARFNGPTAMTVDPSGSLYVTDSNNQTIRQISLTQTVTTIGGSPGLVGTADGIGSAARFSQPTGISFDGTNLYIADYRNNTIRKGVPVSAGPGTPPPPTTGTTPTGNGLILRPEGIASDSNGNIFIADTGNNSIKKVITKNVTDINGNVTIPAGTTTTFAGRDGTAGSADGTGTAATFRGPTGIMIDSANNIYVADTGNATIRKITTAGVVTTVAGAAANRGTQDGLGTAASFQSPVGLAMDSKGNLFVVDATAATIRKINTLEIAATTTPAAAAVPAFTVTTYAGAALVTGDIDSATPTNARFNNPTGLTINTKDTLFVADTGNSTIRAVYTADIKDTAGTVLVPAGTVSTFAGSAGISGSYDGFRSYALFNSPTGLSATSDGVILVADTGNNSIRIINTDGSVYNWAGIAGISEYRDGPSSTALFNHPRAVSSFGNIYIADTGNSSVRLVSNGAVYGIVLKAPTTPTPDPTPTPTPTPSSGGGAMELWFVSGILAVLLLKLHYGARRVTE